MQIFIIQAKHHQIVDHQTTNSHHKDIQLDIEEQQHGVTLLIFGRKQTVYPEESNAEHVMQYNQDIELLQHYLIK